MKVLYVGGVWPLELSLAIESHADPDLQVKFCAPSRSLAGIDSAGIDLIRVNSYNELADAKSSFRPELTIVRNFSAPPEWCEQGEIYWNQEMDVLNIGGGFSGPNKIGTHPKILGRHAFTVNQHAQTFSSIYLPYCIAARTPEQFRRDRDRILIATSLPAGMSNKIRDLRMLIDGIDAELRSEIDVYGGYNGGLFEHFPELRPYRRPSYHPLNSHKVHSQYYIYVSPSSIAFGEGLSYKPFEAMAYGCLVFMTRSPELVEIFGEDCENVVYVSNSAEMQSKIRYFYGNRRLGIDIARRGREFVRKNFSWVEHLTRVRDELSTARK